MAIREIWVAGFPSSYGGADTELDHQIDLWRAFGLEVHLVPMFGAEPEMVESVVARGCHVHDYRDDIFADRVVVSFCNGEFLQHLPAIAAAGRPRCTVWFNCMTWLFETEKELHRRGLIDCFGFVSDFQKDMLVPQLESIAPVRLFDYRPHFNTARVEWRYREWDGTYRMGRISRDDEHKFSADTWRIFDRVLVPAGLQKKVYVLGFGPNAERRIGSAPPSLDWQTWAPNGISATAFYRTIDTMVHKTGGSRESYCRVLVEAYAHGVVPVVENDYAFPDLVVHGETGFMSSDSDEMSFYASWLAMNPAEHRRMAENGRRHLERTLSDPETCWRAWSALLDAYDSASPGRPAGDGVPLHNRSPRPAPAAAAAPSPAVAAGRRRVLAFTCSRERPLLLRNCILQMRDQSHPVDHAVYLNGDDDTRALFDDLQRPGLFLRFGPSLSQHENYANALLAADIDAYDLFCKIDDDDLYRLDYIATVVADFERHRWDYSGTHSTGVVVGRRWLPDLQLRSLGLLAPDHEAGVIEVMPPTMAFSRRALDRVLSAPSGAYEDIAWRRAIAGAGLQQSVRAVSNFTYNVHGQNVSTGHWLAEAGAQRQ